jgi:hypothetical protein
LERNQQQVRWWLAPRSLARALALKVSLMLGGCGAAGALVAFLLFCTPVGAILAIGAVIGGSIAIYEHFEGDDGDHSHPPLVPCPPPDVPPPSGLLTLCVLNAEFPGRSECAIMRYSVKRLGTSDRPTWNYDAHQSTQSAQSITMSPFRMSYPGGTDWVINGQTMAGTQLTCSRIYVDTDGDDDGDAWVTEPGMFEVEIWFSNGDHVNSSSPPAQGGLGHGVYIDQGTTTLTVGWKPSGAKFYDVHSVPAMVLKAMMLTSDFDVVDLPSDEYVLALTGESGYWEEISSSFRFVADR